MDNWELPDPVDDIPRARRRNDEYPCYSEREWRRRNIRHPSLSFDETLDFVPAPHHGYLEESELDELLDRLGLEDPDRAVAQMRVAGSTIRSIAAITALSKWQVERSLERIRAAWLSVAGEHGRNSDGWQDVFRAETRRRGSTRR